MLISTNRPASFKYIFSIYNLSGIIHSDFLIIHFLIFFRMLSPAETVAGQAVCMKLAYAICLKEPELMGELEAYLENMETAVHTGVGAGVCYI